MSLRVTRCLRAWPGAWFVLGLFLFAALVVLPFFVLVADVVRALPGGGMDLLALAWPRGRRLMLLIRSVGLALGVAAGGMTVGILVGTVLWRWRSGPWSSLRWLLLALAPVPPYVHALAWSSALGAGQTWLTALGLPAPAAYGWAAAWWVQLMALMPIGIGLALIGLESVPPDLVEQARLLRSDMAAFIRVVLPLALPTVLAGGGILFLLSLTDYSVPSLFQCQVYALDIFAEYSASYEPARAVLVAVPLVGVTVVVIALAQSALRQAVQRPVSGHGNPRIISTWPGWFMALQVAALMVFAAHVLVPLVGLVRGVGTWESLTASVACSRREIATSALTAGAAALFCLPAALAAALFLEARGSRRRWFFVCAPLAVPAPLVGIALITLWNRSIFGGVHGSLLMPVLAALARFTPLAALVLAAQLRRTDPLLIDAARIVAGNRPIRTWLRIRLPLLMPGLLAAAALVFALTAGELGATLIVAPPGRATLTMRIYNFLHYGASSTVAGLCLVMAAVAVAAGGGAVLVLSSWPRMTGMGDRECP